MLRERLVQMRKEGSISGALMGATLGAAAAGEGNRGRGALAGGALGGGLTHAGMRVAKSRVRKLVPHEGVEGLVPLRHFAPTEDLGHLKSKWVAVGKDGFPLINEGKVVLTNRHSAVTAQMNPFMGGVAAGSIGALGSGAYLRRKGKEKKASAAHGIGAGLGAAGGATIGGMGALLSSREGESRTKRTMYGAGGGALLGGGAGALSGHLAKMHTQKDRTKKVQELVDTIGEMPGWLGNLVRKKFPDVKVKTKAKKKGWFHKEASSVELRQERKLIRQLETLVLR